MNTDPVFPKLASLLDQAVAPVTGRKVAAVIEFTDGSMASGYNIESDHEIIHAEANALGDYEGDARTIKTIHLIASGKKTDIKNALPCINCTKLLHAYIADETDVQLYYNDGSGSVTLNLHDIAESYQASEDVPFARTVDHLPLTPIDQRLVEGIVKAFHDHDDTIQIYLTGSSSGLGGPKPLLSKELNNATYWDIDLVMISESADAAQIHDWFVAAYLQSLQANDNSFTKIEHKEEPSYILEMGLRDSPDFLFRNVYWANGLEVENKRPYYYKDIEKPSTIDVSAGRSLASTLTPLYLMNNWYIRLA